MLKEALVEEVIPDRYFPEKATEKGVVNEKV
jgi:hypothetical protein